MKTTKQKWELIKKVLEYVSQDTTNVDVDAIVDALSKENELITINGQRLFYSTKHFINECISTIDESAMDGEVSKFALPEDEDIDTIYFSDYYRKIFGVFPIEIKDGVLITPKLKDEDSFKSYIDDLEMDGSYLYDTDYWFICEHCGAIHSTDEQYEVHVGGGCTESWCSECECNDAFFCQDCEEYYDSTHYNSYDYGGGVICEECYYNNYCTCNRCGCIIHCYDSYYDEDADENLCEDCWNEREEKNMSGKIRGYHVNPKRVFHTVEGEHTNKYIGVEIETEYGNVEDRRNITAKWGEDESIIYMMHDGSLNDDGIENITQPMSKKYFDKFNFEGWMKELTDAGARSHDTSNCGLHVHLSREWFGSNREKQEITAGTVLSIMKELKTQLQKLARRSDTHWCHYPDEREFSHNSKDAIDEAAVAKHHTEFKKSVAKAGKCGWSRYDCLNTTNDATYEYRIFKGTLNPKTFRASVELCLRLVEYAKYKNRNNSRLYSWEQFKTFKRMPKKLGEYINSKNL